MNDPPAWLSPQEIGQAKVMRKIAEKHDLPLASLAHRFLLTLPEEFKIVIGAVNVYQLRQSLGDFAEGPLPGELFNEIMALITVNA